MAQQLTIGEWTVEAALNTLRRGETCVQVEPKTMQVLLCLAGEPGEVFSKERIIEEVWPETFVTDGVLWNAISELRRAFGDDPRHPSYLATIPKSGYRLIAPVIVGEASGNGTSAQTGTNGRQATRIEADYGLSGPLPEAGEPGEDGLQATRVELQRDEFDRSIPGPLPESVESRNSDVNSIDCPSSSDAPGFSPDSAGILRNEGESGGAVLSRKVYLESPSRRAGRPGARLWTAAAGITAVLLAALFVSYFTLLSSPADEAIDSIAVLPLENTSQDPGMDYLAEGLANSVADNLARVVDLRVVPSSSTNRFGGDHEPHEAAEKLGVRAILAGTLVAHEGNLSIRVELIDTLEDRLLWGEQFYRKPTDLLSLQKEIAGEVSENLRLRLTREEKQQIAKQITTNPEAYRLYLKGNHFRKHYSLESFQTAVDYLEQATQLDPAFAAAYAALADSYLWAALADGWPAAKRAQEQVEGAARRAIELDPGSIDARLVLGLVQGIFQLDPPVYEKALREALALNPRHAEAHRELAIHLTRAGRFEEALLHATVAQEVDPLASTNNRALGHLYYLMGNYREAGEQYLMSLELSPESEEHSRRGATERLGWSYLKQGRIDDALEMLEKADYAPALLYAYRILGRLERVEELSRRVQDELERQLQEPEPWPWEIVQHYVALGDLDEAFRWLNTGYDQGDVFVTNIRLYPLTNELRDDPRFTEFHRRIWGSEAKQFSRNQNRDRVGQPREVSADRR